MRLPHNSLIAAFSHMSTKCAYRIFFLHKLAFLTALLVLFVFLLELPISIRFRYLDHLLANRMAPARTPVERDGVVGSSNSVPYFRIFPPHIWCLCGPHIF